MHTLTPSSRFVLGAVTLWLAVAAMVVRLGPYAQLPALLPGVTPPEERFGASAAYVSDYLLWLGDAGRAVYQQAQWLDFLNALLLAVALGSVVLWLIQRLPPVWQRLRPVLGLPLAVGLTDAVENLLLLAALARHPAPAPAAIPVLTTVKHFLGLGTMAGILVLGIAVVIHQVRRRA